MSFTIANGQILLDGKPFLARGINLSDWQQADVSKGADCTPLLTLFPGLNFVRLATYTYQEPFYFQSFIGQLTAKRIVVEIEHHIGGGSQPPMTGAALVEESNWYSKLATAFKGNPFVWFGTENEPGMQNGAQAVTAQHVATYQAIRATGNTCPVLLDPIGGGNPSTLTSLDPAPYASMKGAVWDLHSYNWTSGYSADQAKIAADLAGFIASVQKTYRTADGTPPVLIGEFGISTDGAKEDPGGVQQCAAVMTSGHGFAAWHWFPGGASDRLTDGSGRLTTYGRQIAAGIAAAAAGEPVTTPIEPGVWESETFQGMPYFLLPPPNYDPSRKYGCLLCLHQFEDESAQPSQWDEWINTAAFREDHSIFVLLPLCEINGQTSSNDFNWGGVTPAPQKPIATALALLDSLADKFDPNQLWIAGNSMGGLGIWGVLCNPDQRGRFAGFLPVAGACYYNVGNEAAIAADLLTTPIWSCHGLADTQVSPQFDINMAAAMKRLGGIEQFTGVAGGGHDQWDTFYANPAVWDWLLSQSKGNPPVSASPDWTTITKPSDPPITDTTGASWTILAANNQSIARNAVPTVSSNVVLCRLASGVIYQQNTSGGVWAWQGGGWVSATMPPQPTQPPVTQPPVTQPPSSRPALQAKLDQATVLIAQVRAALDKPLP